MFTAMQTSMLKAIFGRVYRNFKYKTDEEKWHLPDYWEPDAMLLPENAPLTADCEDFARKCMLLCEQSSMLMLARLVVCFDAHGQGHCICEVTDSKCEEAYYFDCQKSKLATRDDLVGYTLYSASPWNPQPGEQRPWVLITEK